MEAAAAWALELEQEEEQELEQEEQELEQEEQELEQDYWQEELVRKKRAASTTNNYIHVSETKRHLLHLFRLLYRKPQKLDGVAPLC